MMFGHLPFWGDSEEEFNDKIVNAPLKFDANIPITDDCKEVLKLMMQKNPEKRAELIHLIQNDYFQLEDEELEVKIQEATEKIKQCKQDEEEKADRKWEESILTGMSLNPPPAKAGDKTQKSAKTPSGSKGPVGSKKDLPAYQSPFASSAGGQKKDASKPAGSGTKGSGAASGSKSAVKK